MKRSYIADATSTEEKYTDTKTRLENALSTHQYVPFFYGLDIESEIKKTKKGSKDFFRAKTKDTLMRFFSFGKVKGKFESKLLQSYGDMMVQRVLNKLNAQRVEFLGQQELLHKAKKEAEIKEFKIANQPMYN
jgi:hypothetical protein